MNRDPNGGDGAVLIALVVEILCALAALYLCHTVWAHIWHLW
jgi:hypothetical protein